MDNIKQCIGVFKSCQFFCLQIISLSNLVSNRFILFVCVFSYGHRTLQVKRVMQMEEKPARTRTNDYSS